MTYDPNNPYNAPGNYPAQQPYGQPGYGQPAYGQPAYGQPPYTPGYATPGGYYGQPTNRRPTAVTALAVVGILWGLLVLAANGFNAVNLAGPPSSADTNNPVVMGIRKNTNFYHFTIALAGARALLAAALIVGSGLALALKPAGRWLMILYAWGMILVVVADLIGSTGYVLPLLDQIPSRGPNADAMMAGFKVGLFIGVGIGLIYPIFVLAFMNKPRVKAAFGLTPAGGTGYGGGPGGGGYGGGPYSAGQYGQYPPGR